MPLYVESDLFTQYPSSQCDLEDAILSCVSLDTAKIRTHKSIWYNSEQFNYSVYCQHFGNLMLNSDHKCMLWYELYHLQQPHKIFVRPDSGDKSFIPHTHVLNQHYHKSLDITTDLYQINLSEPCIVSSYKPIECEWRLIIIDDKVVTGSLYKRDGDIEFEPVTQNAINYGTYVLGRCHHRPHNRGFVLDVCLSSGQFKIVELNSLSCSDWYNSDVKPIINTLKSIR